MRFSLVLASGNRITGAIPVSVTGAQSCPDTCPLKGQACYARQWPLGFHWARVTEGSSGMDLDMFCRHIRTIPRNGLWKHNQAGDLPGCGNRLSIRSLERIVEANHGRRGFTYTHKPLFRADEKDAVSRANRDGFTINLSADSLLEADELSELGIAPVVTLLPEGAVEPCRTPGGRLVVVCPAKRGVNTNCGLCGLCQIASRKQIIGFPLHGQYRKLWRAE